MSESLRKIAKGLQIASNALNVFEDLLDAGNAAIAPFAEAIRKSEHRRRCRRVLIEKRLTMGLTYSENQRLKSL